MEEIFETAQFINLDGSIEIYEGYEVSNLGRVKSLNYKRTGKEKILRPGTINKSGHRSVLLCKNSKIYGRSVHRLVLSSFNPSGWFPNAVVDHIDSKPENNRLDNLRWVTQRENSSTEHTRQAKSEAKKGSNNPKAQSCVYDGRTFNCIKEAYWYAKANGYNKSYETFKIMIKKEQTN